MGDNRRRRPCAITTVSLTWKAQSRRVRDGKWFARETTASRSVRTYCGSRCRRGSSRPWASRFSGGYRSVRVAVSLAKDVSEPLSQAEGDQLAAQLEQPERAMNASETKFLQSIGHGTYRCEKPGRAMLTIGRQRFRRPEGGLKWVQLHECPRCNLTDRAIAATIELRGQPSTLETARSTAGRSLIASARPSVLVVYRY